MQKERNQLCLCPLEGIIDTISKKWALLIVNDIGNHDKLRFNQLMENLNGISPKALSDTLKKLENERLVTRESFAEIPPRVEYSLTNDGIELRKAIVPLLKWASQRSGVGDIDREKCPSNFKGMAAHRVKGDGIISVDLVAGRTCQSRKQDKG
ncbi:MAG: helix-turn-helix transcriptional regulator [ANME-2 cluster archaeon]|nr:helix-turn-helix transcriptional regulator [ANME-2 cluster archaeon]